MSTDDETEDELRRIAKSSEAKIRENLQHMNSKKEIRANEARQLESNAGVDVGALKEAATAFSEAGLHDETNRVLKRILELVPNDPSSIYYNTKYMAATYREQGTLANNLDELIKEYSRLYEFPDFISSADDSIEYILYECGQHERAIPYQRKGYERDPGSIANKLVHSLYECGHYEEALKVCRSETYLCLFPETRALYANLLEMIGKTRQSRTIRFNHDFSVYILEYQKNKVPEPELVRRLNHLAKHEREVLRTLYNAREKKKSYEQALKEMNDPVFARRLDPMFFTMEEIKSLEESALLKLGVSAEGYQKFILEQANHSDAIEKDFDQKRQKLLKEKYPDLLQPDETMDEEDWIDRW